MKAQVTPPEINTPWQQLKQHKINLESALNLLVDRKGTLALDLLDSEVSNRFLQQVANQNGLPPVILLALAGLLLLSLFDRVEGRSIWQ